MTKEKIINILKENVKQFCEGKECLKKEIIEKNPNYLGRIFGFDLFLGNLKK